jgi:hypothetical protein
MTGYSSAVKILKMLKLAGFKATCLAINFIYYSLLLRVVSILVTALIGWLRGHLFYHKFYLWASPNPDKPEPSRLLKF